jgi:hypothetical protein
MTENAPRQPRPLDHLVLPVHDLETARARYEALGFTVAPDAVHPFGTENACVFFADDTYLEPLGIASRETCEEAALKGNVFVARDQAYRFRRGEDGFSAVVMGTADAVSDDAAFHATGMSAGEMLTFSRPFRTPSGEEAEASFKLAFAADLRAPDVFFFTCERVGVPNVDRSALKRHENGVLGIRQVVGVEPNPSDFQYLVQEVASQRAVEANSFGMEIEAANTTLSVLTPEGFRAFFGLSRGPHGRGLRFEAIVFAVADLGALEARLRAGSIEHRKVCQRVVVDRAPGQGAVFAFEGE